MTPPVRMWAVVGPDGEIRLRSVRASEFGAKAAIVDALLESWSTLKASGHHAIPVTVTPELEE